MDETIETKQLNIDNKTNVVRISSVVHYFLLLLGLTAEGFAITSIIKSAMPQLSVVNQVCIYASVIMMLMHQFLIIRNFQILDHVNPNKYPIGNWVAKCRIEDILRFILFILFAALTGEIIYLLIVSSKLIPPLHKFMTDKTGLYNLSWITPMYLISALLMAIVMLAWDWLGLWHDWNDVPKLNYRKYQLSDKIVYYPLNSPYYTFIFTDFIALYFWVLISIIVFYKPTQDQIMFWVTFLFLFYAAGIGIRIWAEWKVNYPRVSSFVKSYRENTFLWRKKSS